MTDKLYAIMGGGDWADASVEHLRVPDHIHMKDEHQKWREWYRTEYCSNMFKGEDRVKYMSFPRWLKARCGAEDATEVEEFWDE